MKSRSRRNAMDVSYLSDAGIPIWASHRPHRKGRYLTDAETRTKENRTRANRRDRRKARQALDV